MRIDDLKIAFFNTVTLSITFTNIENSLKILLLLVSILYTCIRIYDYFKKKNNETNK